MVVIKPRESSEEEIRFGLHIVIQEHNKFSVHLLVKQDVVMVTGFIMMVRRLDSNDDI